MRGYDSTSYGAGFADVYDDWYADVTDAGATVARLLDLAGAGGAVLELGVGTGRLAGPMAAAGLAVTGIDASREMLDGVDDERVRVVLGDMVTDLPDGPFDAALAAYNTLFNLPDGPSQAACFRAVAAVLRPGGRFVVEAFVPDVAPGSAGDRVAVRTIEADRVVLAVTRHEPDRQLAFGQFVDLTESGGVRLRPWRVRWATPAQLDGYAADAGFDLEHRWADMTTAPFDDDSDHHVSVYRR